MATAAEENRGPQLNAIIWSFIGFSGLFLALRLCCKLFKRRGLWWDDYILVIAWLAYVGGTACTTVSISLGFAQHVFAINQSDLPQIQIWGSAAGTLIIMAASWSKTSFGVTLLRLTGGKVKLFVWFIIVSMNLLMTIQALLAWIQCNPVSKAWYRDEPGQCWNPHISIYFGVVASAYSGVMDVLLALLPWSIVWNLQMKTTEKVGVAVAMSLGIFAGCTAFVKTAQILVLADGDFTFAGYQLAVWGSAEVSTTIMAASIPVLRNLIRHIKATTRRLNTPPSKDTRESTSVCPFSGSQPNTVSISARMGGPRDKSVLGHKAGDDGIMATRSFTVESCARDVRMDPDEMGQYGV